MSRSDPRFRPGMDVFIVDFEDDTIHIWNLIGPCQANNLWVAHDGRGKTESFSERFMSVTRAEALLLLAARYLKEGQEAFRKHKHYSAEARKLLGISNDLPG